MYIVPFVGAEDGSGYVTPGDYQGKVFADQIPAVVRPDDGLVIIFGPRSEGDVSAEELEPVVRQTLDAVRTAAPGAKIVVIGPAWTDPDPLTMFCKSATPSKPKPGSRKRSS